MLLLRDTMDRPSVLPFESIQNCVAPIEGTLFQLLVDEFVDRLTAFPHEFSQNLRSNNPPPLFGMERKSMDPVQRSVKEGFDDLKVNIQRLADFMVVGITNNRETTK